MSTSPEEPDFPEARASYTTIEPTGVPQLDPLLGGGLPKGALSMIVGAPGSGKTTLASQIAFSFARRGKRALILTALSEPTVKLLEHLRSYRFFDQNLIAESVQVFSLQQFLAQGLTASVQEIVAAVRQTKADIVVLDGFQGVREIEPQPTMTRHMLYELGMRLSLFNTTTLITSEADPRNPDLFPEMTTADVLIGLYFPLVGVRTFRGLEVLKVRGQATQAGWHSLVLSDEGVAVFPRIETQVRRVTPVSLTRTPDLTPTSSGRAAFGLKELDALLSGGLTRQTSTLLVGSLGTGKTLLGLHFALAGVSSGEPALFLSFRETLEQLLHKATAFGLGPPMQAAIEPGGGLLLQRWEPVELDPDQVATTLFNTLERVGARRLVIDSIAELERAVTETSGAARAPNYLAALLAGLRARGITLLAVQEAPKIVASNPDFSAETLSILAENVLLLQQLVYQGKLHRVLSVLKMRFSAHDHTLREFMITSPNGLRVLTPVESGEEILHDLAEREGRPEGHTGPAGEKNPPSP